MSVGLRFVCDLEYRDLLRARDCGLAQWDRMYGNGWTPDKRRFLLELMPPGICFEHEASLYDDRQRDRLSERYLQDWMRYRLPLVVICPNGVQWHMDRRGPGGYSWEVYGDVRQGTLSASPSVIVRGYHGFLRRNELSSDLVRPHAPRGILSDGTPA